VPNATLSSPARRAPAEVDSSSQTTTPATDTAVLGGGLELTPPPTLLTADQAGALLAVPGSWLRDKAAAREIPCRKLGKHLRFAPADLVAIAEMAARPALTNAASSNPASSNPASPNPPWSTRGPGRRPSRGH
jgi:hypothetical protein